MQETDGAERTLVNGTIELVGEGDLKPGLMMLAGRISSEWRNHSVS